jgi:hypothetical protein
MKWVIIIGIGVATGSIFLLGQLMQAKPEVLFLSVLLAAGLLAQSYGLGYLTIYLPERKKLLNMHMVILLPWLTLTAEGFILALLHLNIVFNFTFEVPLILVFASIGGVRVHQARSNKLLA